MTTTTTKKMTMNWRLTGGGYDDGDGGDRVGCWYQCWLTMMPALYSLAIDRLPWSALTCSRHRNTDGAEAFVGHLYGFCGQQLSAGHIGHGRLDLLVGSYHQLIRRRFPPL